MQMKKYKVPRQIRNYITDEFTEVLSVEYEKIFNRRIEDDIQVSGWCGELSTNGGYTAFVNTCKKLNLDVVLKYYNSLTWDEGDLFDDKIERMIWERTR